MAAQRIVLFTLGGTIAMAGSGAGAARGTGVVARLSGREILGGFPLEPDVDIEVRDVQAQPSAALTFADVLAVVAQARAAVADGAAGVVLTQGTDTLEETAFLVDAVWDPDAPFVLTGAMRNPGLPGADGPANIAAAVQVAGDPAARGRGALVVFADEVHAARHVRKTHTSSPATFRSPDSGTIAHLVEGVPRWLAAATRVAPIDAPDRARLAAHPVALYTATLDDDGSTLPPPGGGCAGLVVAGFGVGHVPPALAAPLGELAGAIPVVLCSRAGAGSVFAATYAAPGAESDLRARGLIPAGFLHPYKSRVLLRLLVAAGATRADIADRFAEFGDCSTRTDRRRA